MLRQEFDTIMQDAKCWRKLLAILEERCKYAGTKSMLTPAIELVERVKREVVNETIG